MGCFRSQNIDLMKFIKLRNQEFQINVQKFLLNFPNLHSPLNLHTRDPIGYRSFLNIDIVPQDVPRSAAAQLRGERVGRGQRAARGG